MKKETTGIGFDAFTEMFHSLSSGNINNKDFVEEMEKTYGAKIEFTPKTIKFNFGSDEDVRRNT